VADNQKQLQRNAFLQHDAAAVHHVANADTAHIAHEANVTNDQQHVGIPAHHDDHANINAPGGQGREHLAVDNGVGRLDKDNENAAEHAEQVIDRPHGAAAAAML